MRPYLEILPYVGVIPTVPVNAAGAVMLPPVDSAIATWGKSATAVRHPAPPLLPPQLLSGSKGFFGIEYLVLTLNVPKPNSSCVVLPITIPPAASIFSMQ